MSDVMVFLAIALLMTMASLLAVYFDRQRFPRSRADSVPLPVVAEVPVPPPVQDVTPVRPSREAVPIRLTDPNGRFLGAIKIDRRMRRPTLCHRPSRAKTAYTFVAERQEGDTYVYRQVGKERE